MNEAAIADHGIIGDLQTAALVSTDGSVDWFCCPRFDSPSVFGALLDHERGGHFRVRPVDEPYRTRQMYLPDSAVLITRFFTDSAVGEVVDFMPVAGEAATDTHRLVRMVRCVRGRMRFAVDVAPRFDYGRQAHLTELLDSGAVFRSDLMTLTLHVVRQPDDAHLAQARNEDGDVRVSLQLEAGQVRGMVLESAADGPPRAVGVAEISGLFDDTVRFWNDWLARSTYVGRWREMVHRSAITLKLMTYAPTGASWPRRRRVCPSRSAASATGTTATPGCAMRPSRCSRCSDWVSSTRPRGSVLAGRPDPGARRGRGWPAQHHVPGRRFLGAQGRGSGALVGVLDWVAANWDQPEEGIWETRGGRQPFTYGRLMCWVALDRGIRLAAARGLPGPVQRWTTERDRIHAQVHDQGWNAGRRAFVQHYHTDVLDASQLRMPKVGFVAPKDPMWIATLEAMDAELVTDSLVYRYDPAASPDGLRGSEGTFSLCTFAYVDAHARAGRVEESRRAFEKMLTYANHVGLFSEEIALNGEQIGNFPQAFTHLALIDAAITLDAALDAG